MPGLFHLYLCLCGLTIISAFYTHGHSCSLRLKNAYQFPCLLQLQPAPIHTSSLSSHDLQMESNGPFFKEKINLPNTLTILRVAFIPPFMLSFVLRKKTIGVFIYVLSCLTDLADGYLARKFDQQTSFGAFLDPVADKLMVSTALIFLVCQIPTWWFALPVALMINREIAISALREWMAERGKRATVQVGNLGKVKTALQMISTALLLEACPGAANFDIALSIGLSRPTIFSIGIALLYLSTGLALISGFQYFQSAWPVLKASVFEKGQ